MLLQGLLTGESLGYTCQDMLYNPDKQISPGYLEHYEALQKIGIWDDITELQKNIDSLEKFFVDALDMFTVQTAGGLIEFVISRFLDRFVPGHLLFVIEGITNFKPETYYFRKLNAERLPHTVTWYTKLKNDFPPAHKSLTLAENGHLLPSSLAEELKDFETSLILPMLGIGGIFGFVLLSDKITGAAYTGSEIEYLSHIMRFFSVGLQNALNHQSSITDSKTGLFNHSYFMRRLEEELFRARRYKTETPLMIMDLDFFKKVNDTYGHLAGDAVLQEIAIILKKSLRTEDILSRFGGEEFSLLLPSTPIFYGLEIAERLRAAVETMKITYAGEEISVAISIGCAFSHPANPLTPQQIIDQADAALYKSKQNGRNRVTLYEEPAAHSPGDLP